MKWLDVLLRRRPEPEREQKAVLIERLQADSDQAVQRADRLVEAYRQAAPALRRHRS